MADIKTHTTIKDIKSSRDIKEAENTIKNVSSKPQQQIKDGSSKANIEVAAEKGSERSSGAGAGVTYANAKITQAATTHKQRKNYQSLRNEQRQFKKEIRAKNREHKENIKSAKADYKQIKSEARQSNKQSGVSHAQHVSRSTEGSRIKNAKQKYKTTKKAEKLEIKANKRILRTNWRKLLKEGLRKKATTATMSLIAIVMALAAFITIFAALLSPLGVFFSDEEPADGMYSLSTSMAAINQEFSDELRSIEASTSYDKEVILNYGCNYEVANWSDIVAVWDVKLNINDDNVVEIDENKFQEMRTVAWDMISISSWTESETVTETDPNPDDDIPAEQYTITTLKIQVQYSSVDYMCNQYNFDNNQQDMVYFLVSSPEYISLFTNSNFASTVDLSNFDFGDEIVNDSQKNAVLVATNASKYGITARSGYCQAWVADVLQKVNGSRGYASSALTAGAAWSVSKDWTKIQVGAAVYGYASNPYGHVGIYIGGGQVIHNLSGCVKVESLESWVNSYNGVCWGWENGINLTSDAQYNCIGGLI